MEFHFLEARVPLVKEYTQVSGGYEKEAYPMVKHVTSHREVASTVDELTSILRYHSRNAHCLLKGQLSRDLYFESRAGATDPMAQTEWLCLDLDYLASESQVDTILTQMGLGDVSYVRQYGAGHKIDKKFSAHLFFLLDKPAQPEMLKYWLMNQNFNIPELDRAISLQRSNAALRWPLDIMVAHNGMLLYIAPPVCTNFPDPVPAQDRINAVHKSRPTASLDFSQIDSAVIEERKHDKLSDLRKKKGLKAKKFNTRLVSGIEVLSKPGVVTVTGYKEARGFMYLNLGGGDSWGYYHPTDNPEIIYNFKGEPNYLTKELLPEYYKNYKTQLKAVQGNVDTIFMAFLDRRSDAYYRGTFDPVSAKVDIYQTSAVKKIEDFLKQHNQWVGEYIEEWDYVFRFDDSRICVPEERFLNRYQETEYLRDGRLAPAPANFPPITKKILMSAFGDEAESVKRFLNWLAFIVQKRRRAETAWVLSGNQGTGKGLLTHQILAPMLGKQHVHIALLSALSDPFNAFMEDCVLLVLDETDHRQLDTTSKAMAKLKQAITDPTIPIHSKGVNHYQAKNYMSIMLTSNSRSAITVEETDRRFNVAAFQEERLFLTDTEYDKIEEELLDFTSILYKWNIDESVLRIPYGNFQKKEMHELSSNSLEAMMKAVRKGNLQKFIDVMPSQSSLSEGVDRIVLDHAHNIVKTAEMVARRGEAHFMDRDEFHVLLKATSGESISSMPSKFIQQLRHNGIYLERQDGVLGVRVKWEAPEFGLVQNQPLRAVK